MPIDLVASREGTVLREALVKKVAFYSIFPKWPDPPPPFAFWLIGICLLLIASGQKKVTQNFWINRDPPFFGRIP